MDSLLKAIPGVTPFSNDVLISAPTGEEFASRMRTVLPHFDAAGLKVKREKCLLGGVKVDFLGFTMDMEDIPPAEDKIRVIKEAATPKSKAELQAFLGLLNVYHTFLPHTVAVAEPLHRL